jgi:class 3 adenylate cyclase
MASRLFPNFPAELEKEFGLYLASKSIQFFRVALLLGIGVVIASLFVFRSMTQLPTWVNSGGIGTGLFFLVVFVLTFPDFFLRRYQLFIRIYWFYLAILLLSALSLQHFDGSNQSLLIIVAASTMGIINIIAGGAFLGINAVVFMPLVTLYLIAQSYITWHIGYPREFFAGHVMIHFAGCLIGVAVCFLFERSNREVFLNERNLEGAREKAEGLRRRSDRLLLNILPPVVAERLKDAPGIIADSHREVTILFADICNFTAMSRTLSPTRLVGVLDVIFSAFDLLAEKHGVEKIKTIGDAYMLAAGMPIYRPDHCEAVAEIALEMLEESKNLSDKLGIDLQLRIGVNTGPVVAGVIGTKKFIYDLWGDAVNTASRMESHGVPGSIQVAEATYEILKDKYAFEERGVIDVKGKGPMKAWLLKARFLA